MSQWLDAIAQGHVERARRSSKIKRAKPAAAVDGCWDAEGTRIDEPATFDGSGPLQHALSESHEPAARRRRAARRRHHQVPAEADRRARLQGRLHGGRDAAAARVFPGGVCDYTQARASIRCRSQAPICKLPLPSRATGHVHGEVAAVIGTRDSSRVAAEGLADARQLRPGAGRRCRRSPTARCWSATCSCRSIPTCAAA